MTNTERALVWMGGLALGVLAVGGIAYAATKSPSSGPGLPDFPVPSANQPPGIPVTTMRQGSRYTVTVVFSTAIPQTPDNLKTALESMLSLKLTLDPTLTRIAQNTDGTYSGQATGTFKGGPSDLTNGPWTLLQVVSA
jgi:hypothetical protein